MKLISMADFVLGQTNKYQVEGVSDYLEISRVILTRIRNYAEFLKRPLKLEMFVPCDEEGSVLEKPVKIQYFDPTEPVPEEIEQEFYEYEKAKEKVLFEGFAVKTMEFHNHIKSCSTPIGETKEKLHVFWYKNEKWLPSVGCTTVENLVRYGLILTETAKNKFCG